MAAEMHSDEARWEAFRRRAVVDLALAICRDVGTDEVIDAALHTMRAAFPGFRATYWTLDDQGWLFAYRTLTAHAMRSVEGLRFDMAECPGFAAAVRGLEPIVIEDVGVDPRVAFLRESMRAHGTAAVLDVPLAQAEGVFGLLSLDSHVAQAWTAHHVGLLSDMAAMVSVALKDARARQDRAVADRAELAAAARLRAVVECSHIGLLLEDENGQVSFANRPFCALLALDVEPSALVGRPIAEIRALLMSRYPRNGAAILPEADQDDGAWTSHEALHLDDRRVVERDCAPVVTEGLLLGRLWQYRDATERREHERRLLLAERLASLGTLAAGIGHEINNPLTYVLGNLTSLRDELAERRAGDGDLRASVGDLHEDALELVEEAVTGVRRIARIVRDLSVHSQGENDAADVCVSDVLMWAVNVTRNEVRHRATLSVELDDDLPRVKGDETKLGQILINLLVNAARAVPEGEASQHTISLRGCLAEEGWVRLEVEDTGAGIAPEQQRKVFDPFYTTHTAGNGTGLGLFLVQGMVRAMGGRIELYSELGTGTRVVLWLQVSTERHESVSPRATSVEVLDAGRVLVIDDDRLAARAIRRMLGRKFDVQWADGGRAALDQLRRGASYDVLVCDLAMPEMSGMELFRRLSEEWPSTAERVLFLTGGVFTDDGRAFLETVQRPVLAKPLDSATLRRAVGEVIAASGTTAEDHGQSRTTVLLAPRSGVP